MKQENYLFGFTNNGAYSAERIIGELLKFIPNPKSVLDLGCGMGAFGKAFETHGIQDITLIDHPSIQQKELLTSGSKFIAVDLDKTLPPPIKVDVAVCVEVLEHFSTRRALDILEYLCKSSSLILFSAAVPRQGGTGHLNEQTHEYWQNIFKERGFEYSDGFKINLLSDSQILYYYCQNIFLFYKKEQYEYLSAQPNITMPGFELRHKNILNKPMGFRELLLEIPTAAKRSVAFWYRRFKKEKSNKK